MKKLLTKSVLVGCTWLLVLSAFAVDPINPNSTQAVRNVLNYMYSINGTKILSGQDEQGWASNPAQENNWIYQYSGKYPAILDTDLLYRSSALVSRCIAYWNAGGLIMIRWHMGALNGADTYDSSKTSCSINNALTSGTSENSTFLSRLESGASYLQSLEDAGVVVIFAPWHEAGNGCAWFWWAMEGGSQYMRLWNYMYNYMTNTKGLNNLIWLNPQCGTPGSAYYPGKSGSDMVGGDTYGNDPTHQGIYNTIAGFAGSSSLIALHECGYIPDPAQLQSSGTKWILFSCWNGSYLTNHSTSYINTVYNHSYVITRDELPNFRSGTITTGPTPTSGATPTVTGCAATAIVPYIQVNGGTWQTVSAVTVASGATVMFGPQPLTGGSWSWSGCNASGSAREMTIYPTSSCTITATYTNDCGARSTQNFNITVSGTSVNKGDVNNSGAIDIVDALMVAQYYVGLNPAGFVSANADVNCSGVIDIVDALTIAQRYVGLIASFPC